MINLSSPLSTSNESAFRFRLGILDGQLIAVEIAKLPVGALLWKVRQYVCGRIVWRIEVKAWDKRDAKSELGGCFSVNISSQYSDLPACLHFIAKICHIELTAT